VWNEFKGLAISQLEGSLADGPKKVKAIMVQLGGGFEHMFEMEEIVF